jgi:hypothetical protein
VGQQKVWKRKGKPDLAGQDPIHPSGHQTEDAAGGVMESKLSAH